MSRWEIWADNTKQWIEVNAQVAAILAGSDDYRGNVRLV